MEKVRAAFGLGLGASCVLAGGAAVFYSALCYVGVYDGASIDIELPHHRPSLLSSYPLLNNILLLLIFFVSHSLFPRQWLKRALSPLLSPSPYRHMFFIVSAVFLSLVPYGWSPMPHVLWHTDSPALRYTLYGFAMCGLALLVVAFFSVRPLEFCGMQEPIEILTGTSLYDQDNDPVVHGVYGIVRHPMYTGLLITLWSQPTMTQGRMLIAVAMTLYLFIAVPYFEEPDLVKLFGQKYRDYMKTTGMFFPFLLPLRKKEQ
jgi:protein-S-isoprenylcysteine O-methyltransferase Ste14